MFLPICFSNFFHKFFSENKLFITPKSRFFPQVTSWKKTLKIRRFRDWWNWFRIDGYFSSKRVLPFLFCISMACSSRCLAFCSSSYFVLMDLNSFLTRSCSLAVCFNFSSSLCNFMLSKVSWRFFRTSMGSVGSLTWVSTWSLSPPNRSGRYTVKSKLKKGKKVFSKKYRMALKYNSSETYADATSSSV